jgi:hypothetical protein
MTCMYDSASASASQHGTHSDHDCAPKPSYRFGAAAGAALEPDCSTCGTATSVSSPCMWRTGHSSALSKCQRHRRARPRHSRHTSAAAAATASTRLPRGGGAEIVPRSMEPRRPIGTGSPDGVRCGDGTAANDGTTEVPGPGIAVAPDAAVPSDTPPAASTARPALPYSPDADAADDTSTDADTGSDTGPGIGIGTDIGTGMAARERGGTAVSAASSSRDGGAAASTGVVGAAPPVARDDRSSRARTVALPTRKSSADTAASSGAPRATSGSRGRGRFTPLRWLTMAMASGDGG